MTDTPPADPHPHRDWYDKWTIGLLGATFVALVAYTSVAAWQACLTRGQLQQATNALIATQRPWIEINPIGIEGAAVRITLHNSGPSPALSIIAKALALALDQNFTDVIALAASHCGAPGTRQKTKGRGSAVFSHTPSLIVPLESDIKAASFVLICVNYEFALSRNYPVTQTATLYRINKSNLEPIGTSAD